MFYLFVEIKETYFLFFHFNYCLPLCVPMNLKSSLLPHLEHTVKENDLLEVEW